MLAMDDDSLLAYSSSLRSEVIQMNSQSEALEQANVRQYCKEVCTLDLGY
jgi:hypothetical protein